TQLLSWFPLAPVSSPHLSRVCLSRGQQRVSCSAGGDGPHYSWSLDGHPLKLMTRISSLDPVPLVTSLWSWPAGTAHMLGQQQCEHGTANLALSMCVG
ncbi:unnamed protein product, partial [Lota lota]